MQPEKHVGPLDVPGAGQAVARRIRRPLAHVSLLTNLDAAAGRPSGRGDDQLQAAAPAVTLGVSATPADVLERLHLAMNRHDLEAFLDCLDPSYRSEQPVHPNRGFGGR